MDKARCEEPEAFTRGNCWAQGVYNKWGEVGWGVEVEPGHHKLCVGRDAATNPGSPESHRRPRRDALRVPIGLELWGGGMPELWTCGCSSAEPPINRASGADPHQRSRVLPHQPVPCRLHPWCLTDGSEQKRTASETRPKRGGSSGGHQETNGPRVTTLLTLLTTTSLLLLSPFSALSRARNACWAIIRHSRLEAKRNAMTEPETPGTLWRSEVRARAGTHHGRGGQ